jgi:uncharacterized protein (DUF58 family)
MSDADQFDQTRELLSRIRAIEIKTRKIVDNVFSGEYHTVFKGMGMEFSEVRPYQPGDDIRVMDWNVTARAGEPYVKIFKEERELTLNLLVDLSASGAFGSVDRFKGEVAAEICAALSFSAIKNNDKVGLLAFTDQVETFIKARKGRSHALRLIRDILRFKPVGRRTKIVTALDYLNRVEKKKSIVFLVSDFIDQNYEQALRATARKHDLIAIRIVDPRERTLPNVGRILLTDAETGEEVIVNTANATVRKKYEQNARAHDRKISRTFLTAGVDEIVVEIDKPIYDPIVKFFRKREQRRRFG